MYAAWLGALLVGLVLGLLGSGGSILTVPVLVYLVGEPGKLAIAESLGIVALISLVGAIPLAFRGRVSWRTVGWFGGPGIVGAYAGAYLSQFMSGAVQLVIFALVMLGAAALMFRRPPSDRMDEPGRAFWKVMGDGLGVGVLTGLVGVGGGFLIVPALVVLGGLSMHLAVGTSLAIIALKSAGGFVKYLDVMEAAGLTIHWDLVLVFSGIGIVGSFVGGHIGAHVPQKRLKRGFAVFLVVMGVVVLGQNLVRLFG
ncbi:sulfite exporter TauE/SafE family protein [Salinibacter grassmerensis]|uniref:sulfite exporter TauE/SafE family protein n=1 Tax=Salinibacter grassmerensis TaxID=3040353 RepID=UPI0021E9441D|nr:sulfite exporter TauE/SafE family protein [Salinibacter grassmerensis]